MPVWTRLKSSMIHGCRWIPTATSGQEPYGADDADGTLELQFANGQTYTYENVPKSVYMGLVTATSPGSYYHREIKDQF